VGCPRPLCVREPRIPVPLKSTDGARTATVGAVAPTVACSSPDGRLPQMSLCQRLNECVLGVTVEEERDLSRDLVTDIEQLAAC